MYKRLFSPIILGISPIFIVLFVVFALLFHANPQWDIEFSNLFYTPSDDFYMADRWWAYGIYRGVHIATAAVIAILALFIIATVLTHNDKLFSITRKAAIYMLIVMILGPGLTVNTLLKDNVGRARPAHVTEFGGDLIFTPAFEISNQCDNNCSFVSGHAAFGFYWVALALLATSAVWKRRWIALTAVLGIGIGLVRVIQGRHFLSDVIFSFFFVYAVATIVYWIMYGRYKSVENRQ
ncbi:MAG: phosphatase PAP2 family protein [Deferribacteraceae bacterium]|jgi:lipid A 4'-phosphatase|nr:phosphatase PAP2 family protein [Deferribacteraceae bacterium]